MATRAFTSSTDVHRATGSDAMARGLGVLSLALGAMEIVGARSLASMLGIPGQENFIRMCGVREALQGAAILTSRDPTPWIWVRVAGDALDIATLVGENYVGDASKQRNRMLALGAVLGITALDVMNARQLSRENNEPWSPPIDFSKRSGFPGQPALERHGRSRAETGAAARIEPLPDLSGEGQPADAM